MIVIMYMILILILITQAIKNNLPFVFKRLSILDDNIFEMYGPNFF